MDKKKVVFQILDSYAEITITDQQDNIVFFEIDQLVIVNT